MIPFNLDDTIALLEHTPLVLDSLLSGLSPAWTTNNEGDNTWSPHDVLCHLIEADTVNWVARINIILSDNEDKRFVPFDRFGNLEAMKASPVSLLLTDFKKRRSDNLAWLSSQHIGPADLQKTGIHPEFGPVTLSQQLATWAAHDLTHIAQITRVMAKQYKEAIGPWVKYLSIMSR